MGGLLGYIGFKGGYMMFSKIKKNVEASKVDIKSISGLLSELVNLKALSTDMWSPALFKDNYRNNKNYLGHPSLFVIDIDEKLSLEDGKARCDKLELMYAILPTKSHQKEKHGRINDRYRVVLFLQSPIETTEVYNSTWEWVIENWFPEADPQCKDPGRGYYYSTSIYAASTIGGLLKIVSPKPIVQKIMVPTTKNTVGLHWKTNRLLEEGVAKGSRDSAVFAAAADFKRNGFELEEAITKILASDIDYDSTFTEQDAENKVKEVYRRTGSDYEVKANNNDKFKDFILNGIIVQDIESERMPIILNPKTGTRLNVALKMLPPIIGKNDFKILMNSKNVVAKYNYEPFKNALLFTDEETGVNILNEYQPPIWQRSSFLGTGELPEARSAPPDIIKKFLTHLVEGDADSYNYILDWIATAIKSRNLTILTTIGDEGVGKGTLGYLLCDIFGVSNYVKVRSDVFKDKFNSQFENKRLVFVDELGLNSPAEYNRFKDVVNDDIELEKKGKDAKSVRNFASFFIASNDTRAIRPSPGDRRFSLINLTKTKLKDSVLRHDLWRLRDRQVIEQFVGYLLVHKVTHDMMAPFKSQAKTQEITEAALSEWEHYFLYEYLEENMGKTIDMRIAAETAQRAVGANRPPGRTKFENLAKTYKQYFKLLKIGTKRYIKVIGCPKSINVVEYDKEETITVN